MATGPVEAGLNFKTEGLDTVVKAVQVAMENGLSAAFSSGKFGTKTTAQILKTLKTTVQGIGGPLSKILTQEFVKLDSAATKAGTRVGEAVAAGIAQGITGATAVDVALAAELRKTKNAGVRQAKVIAEAITTAEINETKRVRSRGATQVKVARSREAVEATRAGAVAATATATQVAANARLVESVNRVTGKQVEAAAVAVSSNARIVESTNRITVAERNLTQQRVRSSSNVVQSTSNQVVNNIKAEVEAAKRARQLDVAESQQEEKRKTLRLQRFNALVLQTTQAFYSRLRDRRRANANSEISDQKESNATQERILRESLTRRELIVRRSQEKLSKVQAASTAAALGAQTSTGVLGAARGVSPIGASLRRLALVGGGALGVRAIFRSAQDFLANFRRLGAITNATSVQMERLRETSIALGNDLALPGVSAGDAAEALTKLVQAGFSVDQAIGAAKGTLLLARNNTIDFGEAAQFTGSAINAFGIDASKALLAVDVAQKSLVSGGGQSFAELQQATQQAGAGFSLFFKETRGGLTAFQDMNIALAILAKNGLRGSDAGTSLKNFLIRLIPATKGAKGAVEELSGRLGLDGFNETIFKSGGKVRPFLDIVRNLRGSLDGLSQTDSAAKIQAIFGTDAFRAAGFLIGQTNEQLLEMEKAIRGSAGASTALGEAVNKGARAAFDNFTSVIETSGIQVFEKLDPAIAAVVNTFASLISNLVQGRGAFKTVRTALAGIGVALGVILAARGAAEILGATKTILIGMASPAKLVAAGLAGIGAAITIGALVSDDFRTALGSLVGFLKTDVLTPLATLGSSIRDAIFGGATDVAKSGVGLFDPVLDEVYGVNVGKRRRSNLVFDAIARAINGSVIPALKTTVDFIKNKVAPVLEALGRFVEDKILPVLKDIGGVAAAAFGVIAEQIKTNVLPVIGDVVDGFRDGFGRVVSDPQASGVVGLLQDIARVAGTVGLAIRQALGGDFGAAGSTLVGLGKTIASTVSGAFSKIDFEALGLTLFKGLGTAARKLGSAATTIFSEPVIKAIAAAAAGVLVIALQIAGNFVLGFVQGLRGRADDIERIIMDVLGLVVPAVTAGVKALFKTAFSGAFGTLAAIVAAAIASIFGAKVIGKIINGFFKPLGAASRATFTALKGDTKGAIAGYAAYRDDLAKTAAKQAALKRSVGGGLVGGTLIGLDKANRSFKSFHDGLFKGVTAATVGYGRLATAIASSGGGVSGAFAVAGRSAKGFITDTLSANTAARVGSSFGTQLAGAIAGGFASSIGGFLAASSDSTIGKLAGVAGLIGGIGTAFAVAGLPGAAFATITGIVGLALGNASKKAQEARERMRAFSDGLRTDVPAVEAFAVGLANLAAKDAGLTKALGNIGLGFDQFLTSFQDGGPVADIDALRVGLDKVQLSLQGTDASAAVGQLAELRDQALITPAAFETFAARIRGALALVARDDNYGQIGEITKDLAGLLDVPAAGVKGAGKEIIDAVDEIKKAISGTVLTSALNINTEGLFKGFAEARAKGSDLTATLRGLIPNDLQIQLGILSKTALPDLAVKLKGSTEEFDAFRLKILEAIPAGDKHNEQVTALTFLLDVLRTNYLGSARGAEILVAAQKKTERATLLENFNQKWKDLNESTREAIRSAKEYVLLAFATPQTALDQFVVNAKRTFDDLAAQIAEAQKGGVGAGALFSSILTPGAEGAAFRLEVDRLKQDLADQLALAFQGATPEQLPGIINSFLQAAVREGLAEGIDITALGIPSFLSELAPALQSAFLTEFNAAVAQLSLKPELIIDGKLDLSSAPAQLAQYAKDNPLQIQAVITQVLNNIKNYQITISGILGSISLGAKARQFLVGIQSGSIARNSEGSIVTSPTFSTLAEGGRAEAVIPLTKPARALSLLRASGLDQLVLSGRQGDLSGAGFNIGQGAAVGISRASSSVGAAASGLASVIRGTFTKALGIRSPSTVFVKYGRDIVDGLVKGLGSGFGLVRKAAAQLAPALEDGANAATRAAKDKRAEILTEAFGRSLELVNDVERLFNEQTNRLSPTPGQYQEIFDTIAAASNRDEQAKAEATGILKNAVFDILKSTNVGNFGTIAEEARFFAQSSFSGLLGRENVKKAVNEVRVTAAARLPAIVEPAGQPTTLSNLPRGERLPSVARQVAAALALAGFDSEVSKAATGGFGAIAQTAGKRSRLIGSAITDGAVKGIRAGVQAVRSAVKVISDETKKVFTGQLGIRSPSTVFVKYGRDIVDGLAKGLKEGAAAASEAITGFLNVILGNLGPGGKPATGFEQLSEAVREQLADTLTSAGLDGIKGKADAQSAALAAIEELRKDKGFKKGLNANTIAGSANRSELIDTIATAREAIIANIEAGDTTGAKSVFAQLQKALKGVSKAKTGNAAVVTEILAALGLGGADPLAAIANQFTSVTEELRKLLDGQQQQQEQQDRANIPAVTQNNTTNVYGTDPLLLARRLAKENERRLAGAIR